MKRTWVASLPSVRIRSLVVALCVLAAPVARAADAPPAPAAPPIDVLLRLKGVNLEANPAVRTALNRALEATRGTPQFLELVRAFDLKDQAPGLIALAVARPDESAGAEALQRVMEDGGSDSIRQALTGSEAAKVVQALGHVADESAPSLLVPIVEDSTRPLPLRAGAVRALVRTEGGATALVGLARAGKVADDLKPVAATELAAVRWPEIKEQAAELLPVAVQATGQIPAFETIVSLRGDAARGEKAFTGAAACSVCHQVNGRGIDFGPSLTEIGDKYDKQGLYTALVDPSLGIAFGYETWTIALRSGTAFGLITSETDDEVAVKAPGNVVTRHRKSDIVSREKSVASIMPAGLLTALAPQDIADLLEYLSTLKKPR